MPPFPTPLADVPRLTVAQAAEWIERVGAGESEPGQVYLFALTVPPPPPRAPLQPTSSVVELVGLARLRKTVFDRIPQLVTFYLIGCAYRQGAESLRAVAEEFQRRDLANALPQGVRSGLTKLWTVIRGLEDDVFACYFQKPNISLLCFPNGEGRGGVLGADGWRAWAATGEFLTCYYADLPPW